jgi:hypothetical protein
MERFMAAPPCGPMTLRQPRAETRLVQAMSARANFAY